MGAVFLVVFLLIAFMPWLALLAVPLGVWAVSAGMIVANLGGFPAVRAVEAMHAGLLALVGLELEPMLADFVRAAIGQSLELAPAGTNAAACACVKPAGSSYVGVLRIWNSGGHYVLRRPGESLASVASGIVDELRGFGDRFPAVKGTPRAQVHECDPRSCPLRQRRAMARPQLA